VLVVDDNRDAAQTLGLLLELCGHEVRVAHDGREALAIAEAFRPDAVLLDIGLPELDGYAVARALRGEGWARDLELIALTGWGQDEDRQKARDAGFDRHLTKPVDPDALQRLLERGSADVPVSGASATPAPAGSSSSSCRPTRPAARPS
jgi:CheY-like chemotaxis protein